MDETDEWKQTAMAYAKAYAALRDLVYDLMWTAGVDNRTSYADIDVAVHFISSVPETHIAELQSATAASGDGESDGA